MSDTSAFPELDLREQLARIDREMSEGHKLKAETRTLDEQRAFNSERLIVERQKFIAEGQKLMAEARKLDREYWWFPWVQLVTLAGTSGAIGAIVSWLLR